MPDSLLKKGDRHLGPVSFWRVLSYFSEPVPVFQQTAERGNRTFWLWLAALLGLLTLHVWFPRIDPGPLNDTYSVEIGGRNAFFQIAQRRFVAVERNLDPLIPAIAALGTENTLCLLGPARYPTPEEWQAVLNWVSQGGTLLLAARWGDPELEIPRLGAKIALLKERPSKKKNPFRARARHERDDEDEEELRTLLSEKSDVQGDVKTDLVPAANIVWKSRGKVEAPDGEVLLSAGGQPQVARLDFGDGTVVVAASDYIFSNVSLAASDTPNGVLAYRLLETAGATDTIVFDESLNLTGTPKVVGLLVDPALRPITVQVLIGLLLFAWRGNRRFGGLFPAAASARHDITDHTNALGNLYYKAKAGRVVLRAYLEQLRTALGLKLLIGQERRVLTPYARKLGKPVEELLDCFSKADAAADNPRLSRRDAARMIRSLAQIRNAGKDERAG